MTNQKLAGSGSVPEPTVMPLDRQEWRQQLHISNFINTYYQYRDLRTIGGCRNVLIIGPGQGLDTIVLKALGFDVITFDIDETFSPDHIGSVHRMTMFDDQQFDAAIASHVLEHLAEPYLDSALREIARVAGHALIYLPVAGRHFHIRFMPAIRNIDWSIILDVFAWLHKPDGITPRYCSQQHFWEIGRRGWRVNDLKRRFERYFDVIDHYRNRDWAPSYNFVLKSKLQP